MCDFTWNSKFDNNDASVGGLVCIPQNSLDNFCPMLEEIYSHENDKHIPWLTK